ncbi:HTH-type transcriptional repressor PurR [Streptomyces alboniger]
MSFALSPRERARLDDLGMPLIFVSQHERDRAGVYVDDVEAAQRGTRYLLNLGHRRIAYLEPADPSGFAWSSRARLDGYRMALAEAGIDRDDDLVRQVPHWEGPSLDAAVGRLLSLAEPPTAIFAETDDIAFRLLTVLRGVNVPVPQRMSVLGFDGHAMAEPWDLSTMSQPGPRPRRGGGGTGPPRDQRPRGAPGAACGPAGGTGPEGEHGTRARRAYGRR